MKALQYLHIELIMLFGIAALIASAHVIAGAIAFMINTGYTLWQWHRDYKRNKQNEKKS